MNDFTFLSFEDVYGDKKLDILKTIGLCSPLTDYAILTGAYYDTNVKNYGDYWLRTLTSVNERVTTINNEGSITSDNYDSRQTGARIVYNVPHHIEKEIVKNKKKLNRYYIVEYGYYPQTAASKVLSETLTHSFNNGFMELTGNIYTVDAVRNDDIGEKFKPVACNEYAWGKERYVLVKANFCCDDYHSFWLTNDSGYKNGEYVWVRVEPVKWILDTKEHRMISEKILIAGLQYSNQYCEIFENSDIYSYLNTIFSEELVQGLDEKMIQIKANLNDDELPNLYNLDFSKVSEEDIIKGALLSNVSVFLHGRSSDGKSSRVKQLEPDCVILYLRNATPDSLNGKSVYNASTGEMIDVPPTWYKKIVEKCEKEPDKLHIVFFDELTNALPSIQGMAFNIILDGEVNGIWKLPENARIVAAGNDLDDSLAANEMAEPLFNRFAHVYINTATDNWLKWAMMSDKNCELLNYQKRENPSKIHPAIYAYVAYNNAFGKDVLRTRYDGKKPNADPRKWEMASKVLYVTRKPEMLRSLIGEDLTSDFIAFCTQRVISIEDVLNGNYTDYDLQMDTSKKYITIVNLSLVDEENIEVIRDFVSKLGKELLATFDLLWTHGDEARLEKIAELKLKGQNKKLNITLN